MTKRKRYKPDLTKPSSRTRTDSHQKMTEDAFRRKILQEYHGYDVNDPIDVPEVTRPNYDRTYARPWDYYNLTEDEIKNTENLMRSSVSTGRAPVFDGRKKRRN